MSQLALRSSQFFHLLFVLSIAVLPSSCAEVSLQFTRVDSYVGPSQLTLDCMTDLGGVRFWRELNGQATEITTAEGPEVSGSVKTITILVTPENEGLYYCTAEGAISSTLEIVAYPLQNQTIKSVKIISAKLHDDITLPCVFTPGALSHRYTIQWFKGLKQLDVENDTRYSISEDFSLTIKRVTARDASGAYYCVVDVTTTLPTITDGYHSVGPSIRLVVTGSLSITKPPSPAVLLPSPSLSSTFSCTAHGLPPPSIYWLYQGSKVTATTRNHKVYGPPQNLTLTNEGATVTRELTVTGVTETDSGFIECMVMVMEDEKAGERGGGGGERMMFISQSTSLSVLPSSFQPHLLPTTGGVEISFTLPALLPSSFLINVHFYDDAETLVGKSLLVSPTFANTRDVHYVMTADQLPLVTVFLVRVQIVIDDLEGGYSSQSNQITISDFSSLPSRGNTNTPCACSKVKASDSTTQTVLIVFVVILILLLCIAVGVAIWGVVMTIKRLKRSSSKETIDGSYYSRHSSRSRSRSYSSYSGSSSSGSRTPRSSSPSIASSYDEKQSQDFKPPSHGVEVCMIDNKGRAVGTPKGRGVVTGGVAKESKRGVVSGHMLTDEGRGGIGGSLTMDGRGVVSRGSLSDQRGVGVVSGGILGRSLITDGRGVVSGGVVTDGRGMVMGGVVTNRSGSVGGEGGGGGREEPEGSIGTDDYVLLKSAPADILRHRTDSSVSGITSSVVCQPLPSKPFEEHESTPNTQNGNQKENEYEDLQHFKKKGRGGRRRLGSAPDERERRVGGGRGGERERVGSGGGGGGGGERRERERRRPRRGSEDGSERGTLRKLGAPAARLEEEGDWLVVRGIYKSVNRDQEVGVSVV